MEGYVYNASNIPTITATLNGDDIPSSDIFLSSEGLDYKFVVKLLLDNYEDNCTLVVNISSEGETATAQSSFKITRDIVVDINALDYCGNSWYNTNSTSNVVIQKVGTENMLYFSGVTGLYSTNNSWKLGLDVFTIELDLMTVSNDYAYILSYGRQYNNKGWYELYITPTGAVRFVTSKADNTYVESNTGMITTGVKYRLSITRDSNYIIRIFLNGIKIAEKIDKTNFDSSVSNESNILYLGKAGYHFNNNNSVNLKGYMKNIYINKGVCLYTENYTVSEYTKALTTKSLLTFNSSDVGFTNKVDSFNPDINWTNTGCTVDSNNSLVIKNSTDKLISNENELFIINKNNFTLDILFTTKQTNTNAVLFDNRLSSSSYSGIYILDRHQQILRHLV